MAGTVKMLETHEWAQVEGKVATVGITPFAVEQLGDVVFVCTQNTAAGLSA